MNDFLKGVGFFFDGFSLICRPGVKRYVWIPIIINCIVFIGLFWLTAHWYEGFLQWMEAHIPTWLSWLAYILWIIFVISFLVIMTYTFTFLANLIAAPFNGLLAARVEYVLTQQQLPDESWGALLKDTPRIIYRQLQTIFYYLPRVVLFLIFFIVPVIQAVAGVLWFVFNGWMMSVQYLDYPMDNYKIPFKEMINHLHQQRGVNLGFGLAVMIGSMIPIFNFIVMPVAIAAATKLWVEYYPDLRYSTHKKS